MLEHTRLGTNSPPTDFEAAVCCDEYVLVAQLIFCGGMMNCSKHLEDFVDKQDRIDLHEEAPSMAKPSRVA